MRCCVFFIILFYAASGLCSEDWAVDMSPAKTGRKKSTFTMWSRLGRALSRRMGPRTSRERTRLPKADVRQAWSLPPVSRRNPVFDSAEAAEKRVKTASPHQEWLTVFASQGEGESPDPKRGLRSRLSSGRSTPYGFGSLWGSAEDLTDFDGEAEDVPPFFEPVKEAKQKAAYNKTQGKKRESQWTVQGGTHKIRQTRWQACIPAEAAAPETDQHKKNIYAAGAEEVLEEKYVPSLHVLHIHQGNLWHCIQSGPVMCNIVGLFIEVSLAHLSAREWGKFEGFLRGLRFDHLSEVALAFQGPQARVLELLLDVLPGHLPLHRLALIETVVDARNQAQLVDLVHRATRSFEMSLVYRDSRVMDTLSFITGLGPENQKKIKTLEWVVEKTDPLRFVHLRSVLTAFNQKESHAFLM